MFSEWIHFKRGRLLLVLVLTCLLAACRASAAADQPTTAPATAAAPTAVPAAATAQPAPTAAPSAVPAATAEPTGAPTRDVLPAPLYLFDEQQQIARLETDGKTLTAVTREKDPIMGYAVSPIDGTVLYTIGNPPEQKLVRVGAGGGDRVELLNGRLSPPVWAPDGQRYAVSWADGPEGSGVYVALATGGRPSRIAADVPRPKDGSRAGVNYVPRAFSPNGERLLLAAVPDFGPNVPGGDIAVVGWAVAGQSERPIDLVRSGGDPYLCLDPSWSADGAQVYCANYGVAAGKPGLWRIPAAGGQPEVLLASAIDGSKQLDVFNARQIGGQLYAFVGEFASGTTLPTYSMRRLAADGSAATALRADAYDANAVIWSLWAPDGSGAVIQSAQAGAPRNELIWVPASGAAPVTLGATAAGMPQWGPTQS